MCDGRIGQSTHIPTSYVVEIQCTIRWDKQMSNYASGDRVSSEKVRGDIFIAELMTCWSVKARRYLSKKGKPFTCPRGKIKVGHHHFLPLPFVTKGDGGSPGSKNPDETPKQSRARAPFDW